MFHCIIHVQGGVEEDPHVFESLHTLNKITFEHKLLTWVNEIEHHDFCFFLVHCKSTFNTELLECVQLLLQSHL
jgi:hypothetical protein